MNEYDRLPARPRKVRVVALLIVIAMFGTVIAGTLAAVLS
jgi:hypothetical protein